MSELNQPRYKERIDIGPDSIEMGEGTQAGRSKSNMDSRSKKPKRNGRSEAWMKS